MNKKNKFKKEVWFVTTNKITNVYNTRKEALKFAEEIQAKTFCFPVVCVRWIDLRDFIY